VWPREDTWTEEVRAVSTQIRDSKKLTAKRRGMLEAAIKQYAVAWNIGCVESTEIDALGMTVSNRLAFQRALEGIGPAPPEGRRLLIDGCLDLPGQIQIVEPQADGIYIAVAAASILAKEGRDRIVGDLCRANPSLQERYGLENSKGYGTAKHRAAIQQYGVDPGHRRLFLRKLLGAAIHPESMVGGGGAEESGGGYGFVEEEGESHAA
jgi:ribonuclease HII